MIIHRNLSDPEIAERARLASPALLVHDEVPPVLVVHGTLDDLVPVKQGRDFVTALKEHGNLAEMIELPNDDHGLGSLFDEQGVITDSPVMQRIVAFFTEHLGPVPPP
jgi:dipeptidyl aminopeptidase/acylaminoacyl peptidase